MLIRADEVESLSRLLLFSTNRWVFRKGEKGGKREEHKKEKKYKDEEEGMETGVGIYTYISK